MKIGIILPIGRTDKFGYQYHELNKLIIENHTNFADNVIIIASSRYVNKEIFKNSEKIEFICNEKTLFKQKNGEETFSFEVLDNNVNIGYNFLKKENFDVAIQIHINQYIPTLNFKNLRKSCERMVRKNKPFTWLYKAYQCGNLLFDADRKLPWIVNLNGDFQQKFEPDSLNLLKKKKKIMIKTGNFEKFNSRTIIDVFGEYTPKDAKEKFEYTARELRKLNNTFDPNNLENLEFNYSDWINYMQNKFNQKKKSKMLLDEIGKQILNLRKPTFISNIIEEKYSYN